MAEIIVVKSHPDKSRVAILVHTKGGKKRKYEARSLCQAATLVSVLCNLGGDNRHLAWLFYPEIRMAIRQLKLPEVTSFDLPSAITVTSPMRPLLPQACFVVVESITVRMLPPSGWQEFSYNHPNIWRWLQKQKWWPWTVWYPS